MIGDTAKNVLPDQHQNQANWCPDFRVAPVEAMKWQVAIVSRKAADWARRHAGSVFFGGGGKLTTTDIACINDLIRKARESGLCVEYVGPHQVVRF